MTQENQGTSSAVPDNLPVKRKRGRPRKDRSQTQGQVSAGPTPDTETKNQRRRIDPVTDTKIDMVGQAVFGVLDGSFDAGYLLTVRVGDTDTILKGVVFQPGSSVPISGSNDVAPQIKMLKRAEIHVPQVDLPTHVHGSSGQSIQMSKGPDETFQKCEAFLQSRVSPPVNQVPIVPPQSSTFQPQITKGVQNDNFVPQAASNALHHAEDKTKNSANLLAEGHIGEVHQVPSQAEDVGNSQQNNILLEDTIGLTPAGSGHVEQGTPVHPQFELKDSVSVIEPSTLKHNETVKQATFPETKAPSISGVPGAGGALKTEPYTKVMLDQVPAEGQAAMPGKSVNVALECQTTMASAQHMTTGPTSELVMILQENQTPRIDQLGEMLRHEAIHAAPYNLDRDVSSKEAAHE